MARRIIATALWGYFGWYLVAILLSAVGVAETFAPFGGVVMAGIALIDWRRLLEAHSVGESPHREPVN